MVDRLPSLPALALALALVLALAACSSTSPSSAPSSTTSSAPSSSPSPSPSPSPSRSSRPEPSSTVSTVVAVEGEGTVVVERPAGCQSEPGSPTDLSAEPAHWLAFGTYHRWFDLDGCPVRIDVVSHIRGAAHCDWQSAEYLTIGRPFGTSIADDARPETRDRYVWDPEGVLPGGPYGGAIALGALPAGAVDTGLRQDGAELWLGPDDEPALYRVVGSEAQVWFPAPTLGLCA